MTALLFSDDFSFFVGSTGCEGVKVDDDDDDDDASLSPIDEEDDGISILASISMNIVSANV